jgi:CRP-like cAMP-binding protein
LSGNRQCLQAFAIYCLECVRTSIAARPFTVLLFAVCEVLSYRPLEVARTSPMAAPVNRLIQALSPASRTRLLGIATAVQLPQRASLSEPNGRETHAYFLTSGLASLVVTLEDGGSAEIAMIGNEGVAGATGLLGPLLPVAHCFMQITGTGYRVPMADLRRLFEESTEIRERLLQSIQQQTLTMNQIAACNKLHQASERFARWLLTAADRSESETVSLTQESLSQMLGTRRTTVALVAGLLQRRGLIRYRRGVVTIADRERMEEAACDCYRITRRLLENLYEELAVKQ